MSIKPLIIWGNESEAVKQGIAVLAASGTVYQRGGQLVRITPLVDEGLFGVRGARIEAVKPDWLRVHFSGIASFGEMDGSTLIPLEQVPSEFARLVLASNDYPGIPVLTGVNQVPVYLGQGRCLSATGYDPQSGLFFVPRALDSTWCIPDAPTKLDAELAAMALFDVVSDFPFAALPALGANRAAWLAWLLTLCARYAISGPVPFTLLDASSPGAGKNLLSRVTCEIALGRQIAVTACSSDQEELRRALLPHVVSGARLIWLDEVRSPFGGPAINIIATAWPFYSDRAVRTSEAKEVPVLSCLLATGNNVELASDASRRALLIRLEPQTASAHQRDGFEHADLNNWVCERRESLLACALTILRAHHLAGTPTVVRPPLGGFESWDQTVRQAVIWVTGVDPLLTQFASATTLDTARNAWIDIVLALSQIYDESYWLAKDALFAITANPDYAAAQEGIEALTGVNRPSPHTFSFSVLRRRRDSIEAGFRLEMHEGRKRDGKRYRLVRVSPEGTDESKLDQITNGVAAGWGEP